MELRRGVACRVSTSWVIYHVVELYAHVVDANNVVGNMEHVVENMDVVGPHRGCTLACRGFGACRGILRGCRGD